MRARYLALAVPLAAVIGCASVSTGPRAASEQRPHEPGGVVQKGGYQCGVERWAVKTLTDPAAGSVSKRPIDTTVAQLDAMTAPAHPEGARTPQETKRYRLTATLVSAREEADNDFHLLLRDGAAQMIAEVTDAPPCTKPPITARVSTEERRLEHVRQRFVQRFGRPSDSMAFTPIGTRVRIVGVLFFDRIHNQRGVAPNGVELHPVLAFAVK